ncbi:MAG: tetratricopeptide repeat protein [bacterium]|nr:tetratricopeptide repeat protein [bacterium]
MSAVRLLVSVVVILQGGLVRWGWAAVQGELPSNGTVFAAALLAPNLGAASVVPQPQELLDPLVAARVSHWRCRYVGGRLVELSRRDEEGSLAPMQPPQGEAPTHGYLFRYEEGDERPSKIVTPSGVTYELEYDGDGRVRRIWCRSTRVQRGFPWTEMRIGYRGGRVAWLSYWDEGKASSDEQLVHRKEFTYDGRGFTTSVSYYNEEGMLWGGVSGIARVTFERGMQGEWLSVTYWASETARTTDWFGVSQYRFVYTSDGRIVESLTLDTHGRPATNAFGAYRMEWQYSSAGEVIGARGYAEGGVVVYDGQALMPEFFDRTLADAILQRVREELAPPYWRLADYVELQRASRRWQRRCVGARGGELAMLAECGRVLVEYLLQARAGPWALQAVLHAHALGLNDRRLLQRAVIGSGVVPHPESRAARTLLGMELCPMPSNTLFMCGTDVMYLLSLYATGVRHVRSDILPVSQNLLADSAMNEAMRARYGTRVWLPDVERIQAAVREELRGYAGVGVIPETSGVLPIRIRGREVVARINARLAGEVCQSNSMWSIAVEEGYENARLYPAVVVRGPFFWYGTNVSECGTPYGGMRWWGEVARGSSGWPKDEDWKAVRRVLARQCAAQGSYWWQRGEKDSATQLFEVAISMGRDEREVYVRYAQALLRAGRYDEAVRVAERWAGEVFEDPLAQEWLERCERVRAAARELAQVEERVRGGGADVLSNLLRRVELLEILGDVGGAQTNAAALLERATGRVDILEPLTEFYSRQQDATGVERCLSLLTAAAPQEFRYWVSRAALAFARRAPEEGVALLRKAAELDRLRLRRILREERLLLELRASGQTNLVQELLEMIEE